MRQACGVELPRHEYYNPKAAKQPERIAPHGDRAATACGDQSQHGDRGSERNQGNNAAVKHIGAETADGGEVGLFAAGRGQTNMAAIRSAGSMKKNCPTANSAGCKM